ncbi:MAG TPA: succinate dehydrogenase cytochrome b subunit [Bryobacteraceae bacterium]|nr:succinate dehydrogenase cytochrome b subunit [Bryobacteraceae bacterium]
MSAVAVNSTLSRGVFFYRTTLGKKAVMAVTGLVLFGFVITHMGANLLYFAGPDALNGYALKLRDVPPLLWGVRALLFVSVVLHIVASVQLARIQAAARPVGYIRKRNVGSTYAARTMMWSGPIIAAFLIYHLMHLTLGVGGLPFEHLRPYENLVAGFSNPAVSIAYIVAMTLLGMHLYHGVWSMFQTMGVAHPRYTPKLKFLAKAVTVLIVLGFISVPIAIMLGLSQESTLL